MDRKSFIAMIIVALIIILMPYYNEYILGIKPKDITKSDSLQTENVVSEKRSDSLVTSSPTKVSAIDVPSDEKPLPVRDVVADSVEKLISINTDKYSVIVSNKGGGQLVHFKLLEYKTVDSAYVELINDKIKNGLDITFQDIDGNWLQLANYNFIYDGATSYQLHDSNDVTLSFSLSLNGATIRKIFTFYGSNYHFDMAITFDHPEKLLLNRSYQLVWKNGIPSTEKYVEDDYRYNTAYAYMADELEDYSISDEGPAKREEFSGKADWIAIRNKYFVVAINQMGADVSDGVFFSGYGLKKDDILYKYYDAGYNVKSGHTDRFRAYVGPLDYRELEKYDNNLDVLIMSDGWSLFRPISRYLILPVLEWMHSFIPNYGLVIILFSIIVKLVLFPLTKHSYESTKRMQKMQPLMNQIKEKYKNDPQRQQKEMMKLYQEHGNPMSGCLPMLLQMPLLFALYQVFKSTIQLRGAMFIPGWIPDLSTSENLFTLPFHLPFYGNEFNLLPIIMAATMFFQSKMTMQDPKQKQMLYFMPIFMLVLFNRFPSGLNLYYTLFNVLTIIQQKYIHVDEKEKQPQTAPVKSKKKK